MKKITSVAKKIDLNKKDLLLYGDYKAKIIKNHGNKEGRLVLVTSINPTPTGEGKTTLSIGLNDSLNKIGIDSIVALREPSLGPVFGIKGGAIGGGKAVIEPSEDINLHFNGDFHAITAANNLLCAIVDNHIYQGNKLKIKSNIIKRCLDVNDRSLRDDFVITTASEMMAIFCLCKDLNDIKERIGNIIVGYNNLDMPVYARDLHAEEACTILLKEAIYPNLVQTLYHNPAFVHGGPFANIAHGCSSLVSTKLALNNASYVITEAGFGSDMGGIKFFDLKCRLGNIYPDVVVINTTIKALKYHGKGILEDGINNLLFHINNMKKFNSNIIVALNRFNDDTEKDINYVKDFSLNEGVLFSECNMYNLGENGCIDLAKQIINLDHNKIEYQVYDLKDNLETKIKKMCELYGCNNLEYTDQALINLKLLNNVSLPICIAKTPNSITDNKNILGYPKDFTMHITDIKLYNGAGFIVIYMGNVLTMPGLGKKSKYLDMKIINNKIIGLK